MALDPGRELLILGILRRAPISAYDLTRAVKMHGTLYRSLARGNLYAQIAQLERAGYARTRRGVAARGPSGTKTVYQISAAGSRRFEILLSGVLADVQSTDDAIEVACVLLGQLPRDRAQTLLSERLRQISDQQKRFGRQRGQRDQRSGAAELSIMHAEQRLQSEVAWLRDSIALLRGSKWKPEWRNNDEGNQ